MNEVALYEMAVDEDNERTVIYGTVTINVIEQYASAHADSLSPGGSLIITRVL